MLHRIQHEPEKLNPRFRHMLEVNRRGPAVVAFVERGSLPESAVALVIRDPDAQHPRLLVLEESTNDWEMLLARRALFLDEVDFPEIASRRVVRIVASGVGFDVGGEQLPWITPLADHDGRSAQREEVKKYLQHARKAPVEIPSVGRARIVIG